jgi:anti-sigma factor RsiW
MMIDRTLPVTEEELHAYVDGELPHDRNEVVENWLATHPDDMLRVGAWRAQAESIRSRYGAVAVEPAPERLALDRLMASENGWRSWRGIAAAAGIALMIGGAGGWFAHAVTAENSVTQQRTEQAVNDGFTVFTSEAIQAYKLYVAEVRHPVEVTASDADHLVRWLSKRVGYKLRAPNLDGLGLKLVGGRLLPGPTGAAAFFMYENASGERYTLYCGKTKAPATALRYNDSETTATASAVYWSSDEVAYVISGRGDRKKLKMVAAAVYEQLETQQMLGKSGG